MSVAGGAYKGKNALIIGSNNSAHDIAAELFVAGANVTILQVPTHITCCNGY